VNGRKSSGGASNGTDTPLGAGSGTLGCRAFAQSGEVTEWRQCLLRRMSPLLAGLPFPSTVYCARLMINSQVAQEVQYVLLVRCTEHIERIDHLVGFRAAAGMLFDGSQQVVGTPVVQEKYALANAP
jgi:hypothetical protein